ncbi:isoleucine--tRNA ligase, partial [bacterium]
MGYKDTVNLPKTDFPMRASLPQREPGMIKRWDGMKVYKKMLERRRNAPLFVLHDGPPYSNGHIHLGHTLNKVVKDIIVKYKYLSGYRTPFVPGWDNHGMPIENIVIKEFKGDKSKIREIRKRCREFAGEWIDIQREEFRRLGVFGDWDNPYLTMSREYEGREILFFADLVEKGYVYRGYMPIHWCPVCETALALAEIEYKEKESPSIWFTMEGDGITAVVWTTTPWTIISNVALAFHPDYEYVVVKVKDKNYVLARELLEKNANLLGWENFEV